MNYKNKLFLMKLINVLLVVMALLVSYGYFHKTYMSFLNDSIDVKIEQGKRGISTPLLESKERFKQRKPLFKEIHADALARYKANRDISLAELKNQLTQKYHLQNTDIQLFLVDRSYKVFDTTYTEDIGFDLSVFPETVKVLDDAFRNDYINLSDLISRDPLDLKYKMYSYAKVDENTILELGFIDSNSRIALFNALQSLDPTVSATLYHVLKDGEKLFYFPVKENISSPSKEAFYSSQTRFNPDDPRLKTDPVMQAFLEKKRVMQKKENAYHVYASIYDLQNADIKTEYENIVLKFDLDASQTNQFLRTIQSIFIITALSSVLILFGLYHLIKREIEKPFGLITKQIKQGEKIPLNELPNQHDDFYQVATEYNELYDQFTQEVQKNADLLLVDHLTQVQNRKAFDIKIQELLTHYQRYEHPFSILMFDIDDFKKVNDALGHQAGDKLLSDFAQLITSIIRESDFFYRIGGEEFVVLLPETAENNALVVSSKIRETVESHFADIREHRITISGGLCTVKPYDTKDSLFKCADTLLYQAKAEGKNRVVSKHSGNC